MIKHYNHLSLLVGVPGLTIQTLASIHHWPASQSALGTSLAVLGTALLVVGLAFYAKAKAWHPAWGLLGLFSVLGAIVLGLFPDHSTRKSAGPA